MTIGMPDPMSFIKMGVAAFLIAVLVSSGGDAAGEADAESRTPSIQDRPSRGGSSEPDWAFSYSGALSGEVSDGVTVVRTMATGMNSVTLAARSYGTDAHFSGTCQSPRDGDPLGEKTRLSFNLTLEDGTQCQQRTGRDELVLVRVIDGTQESYSAELSGTIRCGERDLVEMTGYLRS